MQLISYASISMNKSNCNESRFLVENNLMYF